MRNALYLVFLTPGLLLGQSALHGAQQSARPANPDVAGRWIVNADAYGTPINLSLELAQQGDKLTGHLDGDRLEGTLQGNTIHFLAKDEQGNTTECQATVQNRVMSGTLVFTE